MKVRNDSQQNSFFFSRFFLATTTTRKMTIARPLLFSFLQQPEHEKQLRQHYTAAPSITAGRSRMYVQQYHRTTATNNTNSISTTTQLRLLLGPSIIVQPELQYCIHRNKTQRDTKANTIQDKTRQDKTRNKSNK